MTNPVAQDGVLPICSQMTSSDTSLGEKGSNTDPEVRIKEKNKKISEAEKADEEKFSETSYFIPKDGINKESEEIKNLITDYISDAKNWLLSDTAKNLSEKEINQRLETELQIRCLMYLDIIRNMRYGVR